MTDAKPEPRVDEDGVPWCAYNDCGRYDEGRCVLMEHRSSMVCEPAVADLSRALRDARACIRRMSWHFRDTERMYFAGETEHRAAFNAAMAEGEGK